MENFIKEMSLALNIDEKIVAQIYKEGYIKGNEDTSSLGKKIIRKKLDNIIYGK